MVRQRKDKDGGAYKGKQVYRGREGSGGSEGSISSTVSELGGIFPNYYGEQRFGYRKTNFNIGLSMLKGDFKAAALNFLTSTQNETMDDAREARKRLSDELDFGAALDYFPKYLKYERSMLEYLSKYPTNYANAIRKLPRSLSLMFIHSVEAQIFNWELDERIKEAQCSRMPRTSYVTRTSTASRTSPQ